MKIISPEKLVVDSIERLGLNPAEFQFGSVEVIAQQLRRLASFMCPCTYRGLVARAVEVMWHVLLEEKKVLQCKIEEVLDGLISTGDLLEFPQLNTEHRDEMSPLLYAAPPGYILRSNYNAMIVGIVVDHVCPLPMELQKRIKYRGTIRILEALDGENLGSRLQDEGLTELMFNQWNPVPKNENSRAYLDRYISNLMSGENDAHGDTSRMIILDPKQPVTYYNNRWVPVTDQSGHYIAKREQEYGAPLWCFVHLDHGKLTQLKNLPSKKSKFRGCDEAWRLQAAIDAERETPQVYRCRTSEGSDRVVIDLFSPIPSWIDKRLTLLGERVEPQRCLMSYAFSQKEVDEEISFLKTRLWMIETEKR